MSKLLQKIKRFDILIILWQILLKVNKSYTNLRKKNLILNQQVLKKLKTAGQDFLELYPSSKFVFFLYFSALSLFHFFPIF